jgi:hypothetical protein
MSKPRRGKRRPVRRAKRQSPAEDKGLRAQGAPTGPRSVTSRVGPPDRPPRRDQKGGDETAAREGVAAIENVRLLKELEARNRELSGALDRQSATADVLRIIAQSPTELQPVLDAIAASAVRLCEGSDAVIERLEGASEGADMSTPRRGKRRSMERILQKGAHSREALVTEVRRLVAAAVGQRRDGVITGNGAA